MEKLNVSAKIIQYTFAKIIFFFLQVFCDSVSIGFTVLTTHY